MQIFAILGATASGKSDLAIRLARALDCFIFSLDSLAIYREIDIASAKPEASILRSIRHFGINELIPDQPSHAALFVELFHKALEESRHAGKESLLLVGGTGFFLKCIMEGVSPTPLLDDSLKERLKAELHDLPALWERLYKIDPAYIATLARNDAHRLRRALEIYEGSGLAPSEWFALHPPTPLETPLCLYELTIPRETLRERIARRTEVMLESGLIDEVCYLEARYTRAPQAMKSIGIIETLGYLDGAIPRSELAGLIATHTAQLAKRQVTFNKTQFGAIEHLGAEEIYEAILRRAKRQESRGKTLC